MEMFNEVIQKLDEDFFIMKSSKSWMKSQKIKPHNKLDDKSNVEFEVEKYTKFEVKSTEKFKVNANGDLNSSKKIKTLITNV
jgi:hypothetical protein